MVLIGSAFSLGYAVGFLIFGWLANYFETKKLLMVGMYTVMGGIFSKILWIR